MTDHKNKTKFKPGVQNKDTIDGMDYYLYLPPGNPPPGGWPILLFTHGIGESSYSKEWKPQTLDQVKVHGSPADLCAKKPANLQTLLSSFIVISPQFPVVLDKQRRAQEKRPSFQWEQRVDSIRLIIEAAVKNLNGNRNKIYGAGFSRGGWGALELSRRLQKPYKIAKLILVDSERVPNTKPKIPTWIHYAGPQTITNIVKEHAGVVEKSGKGTWVKAPPGTPLPDGDYLFTNRNLNFPEQFQNHTETSRETFSDSRIYEWLLKDPPQVSRTQKAASSRKTQVVEGRTGRRAR